MEHISIEMQEAAGHGTWAAWTHVLKLSLVVVTPSSHSTKDTGPPQSLPTPKSITFINDDCKAPIGRQPHTLDVVLSGERQCI